MRNDELRKILGTNIMNMRLSKNMSLDDLAAIIDVTPGFLGLIEKGRRGTGVRTLLSLSKFFNCSLEYFFSEGEADCKSDELCILKERINGLLYDMNQNELEYALVVLANLRKLRK